MAPRIDDGQDLVDRVRSSCAELVEAAELVAIDAIALEDFAAELSIAVPGAPPEGEATDPTLVFALDAINFGSGYHDIVRKRDGLSGARTMAAALTDYVSWTGPLTPERLQSFTVSDCSQIFGQELDGGGLEQLMSRFSTGLQDLGHWLASRGGAASVIENADGSAVALATALTAMPFFDDRAEVPGSDRIVEFHKRAQITAADLSRDAGVAFDDLHRLTAFADNLVPHVLRVVGAIRYDDHLAETIDRGELLAPGGRAELEIRAAGVVAVEQLAALTGARPMDLDLSLWTLGGEPEFKAIRRHRCRSVFY